MGGEGWKKEGGREIRKKRMGLRELGREIGEGVWSTEGEEGIEWGSE